MVDGAGNVKCWIVSPVGFSPGMGCYCIFVPVFLFICELLFVLAVALSE